MAPANEHHYDLMGKYLSGEITVAERQELLLWAERNDENKKFFEEMIQLWTITADRQETIFATDTSKAWMSLEEKMNTSGMRAIAGSGNKAARINGLRRMAAAVAAIFVVSCVVALLAPRVGNTTNAQQTIISTQKDERKEAYKLPDGSRVWLNENSSIAFDDNFEKRIVKLTGEGYFEVEKKEGEAFIVHSEKAQVTVLGTAFNLRAYPDEATVEVAVTHGKVELKKNVTVAGEKSALLLQAGEMGALNVETQQLNRSDNMLENADSWRTRVLKFDGVTLQEALPILSRYFNTAFRVQNRTLLHCPLNIMEMKDPQVQDMITMLEYFLGVVVQQTEQGFIIEGKGCK